MSIKLNFYLTQNDPFVYTLTRFKSLERDIRFNFEGYTARLTLFDYMYPTIIYDEFVTGDGIELYDGEIRIHIPGTRTAMYTFDVAEYRLVLIDKHNQHELFCSGFCYLDLAATAL